DGRYLSRSVANAKSLQRRGRSHHGQRCARPDIDQSGVSFHSARRRHDRFGGGRSPTAIRFTKSPGLAAHEKRVGLSTRGTTFFCERLGRKAIQTSGTQPTLSGGKSASARY